MAKRRKIEHKQTMYALYGMVMAVKAPVNRLDTPVAIKYGEKLYEVEKAEYDADRDIILLVRGKELS